MSTIIGSDDHDVLLGTSEADLILGKQSDDILSGGNAADIMTGNKGKDVLNGGNGADVMHGGIGADTLTGGKGADTFVFEAGKGHDMVTDFDLGTDMISIINVDETIAFTIEETSIGTTVIYDNASITLLGVYGLDEIDPAEFVETTTEGFNQTYLDLA